MDYETLYERIVKGEEKLALIGLGYVGMPIAVEFAKHPGFPRLITRTAG